MAVESTGCDCILLSGDTDERTRNAAANAGIREYHPQCMPLDRLEKIQEIKERFPSNSVLYVDYGGSDSSSLSAADVGVCLNGLGSETPFQAGDVVIMGRSMTPLADAIDSGKLTQRITRQTLLIILAEKLLLLLLALFWRHLPALVRPDGRCGGRHCGDPALLPCMGIITGIKKAGWSIPTGFLSCHQGQIAVRTEIAHTV